jgi:hypothetical protein
MKINLKFLSIIMVASALLFSSFTLINNKKQTQIIVGDENIEVSTGLISGANSVQVSFSRTGAEAGDGDVEVTYKVKFNEGTSSQRTQTFTQFMANGETSLSDYIQGPNPTAWAEVIEVSWVYL